MNSLLGTCRNPIWKVSRYSGKCFPTDTSQKKKGWTHPSSYFLSSWRLTLLDQWFKGCLNLQWTQMFCIFIQDLFSVRERCEYPTACFVMVLGSSFSGSFSASAQFNQIIHESGLRLGTNFVREQHALPRKVTEGPGFDMPDQIYKFSKGQICWGLEDAVKTKKSNHKGFTLPKFIPLTLSYLI